GLPVSGLPAVVVRAAASALPVREAARPLFAGVTRIGCGGKRALPCAARARRFRRGGIVCEREQQPDGVAIECAPRREPQAATVHRGDRGQQQAIPLQGDGIGAEVDQVIGEGAATTIVFRANKSGAFEYLCTIPGHKLAGMFGKLIVGDVKEVVSTAIDVAKDPAQVGEPVGDRAPQHITYDLLTTEVEGQLSDGSTYRYWTFDNTVPGPLLRIRQGDTVTINLKNAEDSINIHSVDFHSVTGPGGG